MYPHWVECIFWGGFGSYSGESSTLRNEISYVELDFPETTDAPTTTEESICPPEGIHNFPYPGNCTLYIRCFHGVPQTLSCYPLRFDTIDLVCKPVADAYCDQEYVPTTEPPTTTQQPEPSFCSPIGYEVFPHESNCRLGYNQMSCEFLYKMPVLISKYYECNTGVA